VRTWKDDHLRKKLDIGTGHAFASLDLLAALLLLEQNRISSGPRLSGRGQPISNIAGLNESPKMSRRKAYPWAFHAQLSRSSKKIVQFAARVHAIRVESLLKLNRIEAMRRIPALNLAYRSYVMIVTANAIENKRQFALKAGLDSVSRKPFKPEDLEIAPDGSGTILCL
jgi:CheY-like chemotaxis protein